MRSVKTTLLWGLASLAATVSSFPQSHNDDMSSQSQLLRRDAADGKYFQEAGKSYQMGHYDKRFFSSKVSGPDRRQALRDLIRSYLTSTDGLGVETWIAHGTLLGWWWNGRILPWDSDIDVQTTNATLQYFADHLNATTFVYNYTDPAAGRLVSKSYLLDVNPHFVDRTKGDGDNVIDARWIDVATGLFIDITAVRERDPDIPGQWSCKNQHRYNNRDLWPLRTTQFEGVRARVPYNFQQVLLEEYDPKSLVIEEWEYHRWDDSINDWVKMTEAEAKQREAENSDRRKEDLGKS